jgi:hypothetical protein
MKVVEENARRERAECEAQKQIVASLINRFGGSSNSFSGRLPQLNSLSDAERADLYKKMDMLLEELSLHNVQLKVLIDIFFTRKFLVCSHLFFQNIFRPPSITWVVNCKICKQS